VTPDPADAADAWLYGWMGLALRPSPSWRPVLVFAPAAVGMSSLQSEVAQLFASAPGGPGLHQESIAMTTYIGTKLVKLFPMSRLDYNAYRGWALPANENGSDQGYLVEYTDGGKPNDARHQGYISWSPKEQADAAYRPADGLSFGLAIEALKMGHRVARTGWNGKGMFLLLVPGSKGLTVDEGRPLAKAGLPIGTKFDYLPHIDMWTAQGDFVPWLASQTDMLADDWQLVEAA